MTTTGKELKLKRVEADVLGKDLAAEMKVAPSAVSRLENSRLVTENAAERYLAALDTCITKSTRPSAEQVA